MEKSKIFKILGSVIGVILLIVIVAILIINKNSTSNEKIAKSTEIMDNFYKYYESKNTKVIYLVGKSCTDCEFETPIMKQLKKDYKLDYLYVNMDKLIDKDRETIEQILKVGSDLPVVAVVKDGEVEDVTETYLDGNNMVQFLIESGALKESSVYKPEQYLTEIEYSDYEEIVKKDELGVVVIGQTLCSHCIETKPVLNHIAGEYDITINYLNITNMGEEELNKLISSLKELKYEKADELGTPLTLIVKNNSLIDVIEGEQPPSYFLRKFRKSGVIVE